jgi:hypothetical protein
MLLVNRDLGRPIPIPFQHHISSGFQIHQHQSNHTVTYALYSTLKILSFMIGMGQCIQVAWRKKNKKELTVPAYQSADDTVIQKVLQRL